MVFYRKIIPIYGRTMQVSEVLLFTLIYPDKPLLVNKLVNYSNNPDKQLVINPN